MLIASQAPRRVPARELARQLGCSTSHLSRTFTRVHGQTLRAYRLQIRLHHAIGRLRADPGADLTDVALASGFSSHSHFTWMFRRELGVTPSTFAAHLLSAQARTSVSAAPCDRYSR